MSVREEKRKNTEELIMELLVIRNILFKMEFDELAENESLFIEFVNCLENPPKSVSGDKLTYMGYRQMMKRYPENKIRMMIEKISSEPDQFTVR